MDASNHGLSSLVTNIYREKVLKYASLHVFIMGNNLLNKVM